ncbi:MAG TPA: acyltransferase family protein [Methanoregula sp.]|nr:acyltransferase family protein [Methanoregula sp.]
MSSSDPAGTEKGPRLLYIDNIRILLICLVIATHCSITYGGPGSWYFTDPGNAAGVPFVLTVINALNQSFFMGFFLLVSAYFVPSSLMRKGRGRFTRDRLIRLGVPLVVWVLVLSPLLGYIVTAGTGNSPGPFPAFWIGAFVPFQGLRLGLMWFVFFLLMATLVYLGWTAYRQPECDGDPVHRPFPSFFVIVALGFLLGLVTAVVRIFLPIGSEWYFSFQLPFFPQYIAFFIAGLYAARNRWLDDIPDRAGKACGYAALALVIALVLFVAIVLGSPEGLTPVFGGGLYWQSVFFAFLEQMTGAMIIVSLLWLFFRRFNTQGPTARAMAGDSYTVYIIHPLVLVLLSVAFAGVALPSGAKFALVLPLTIAAAFTLAHLIRAVPGVKRVL